MIDDKLGFSIRLLLFSGLMGLGVALGSAFGLAELQAACIDMGELPAPGSEVPAGFLENNPCWTSAKLLQKVANVAGILGAIFLLSGAVLDTYEERVREVIG